MHPAEGIEGEKRPDQVLEGVAYVDDVAGHVHLDLQYAEDQADRQGEDVHGQEEEEGPEGGVERVHAILDPQMLVDQATQLANGLVGPGNRGTKTV